MQLSISLRPRKLSDVYGQASIVKALQKRAATNDFPNAMLLKGMTGTGKTTVAQIIAMIINCTAKEDKPCGICPSCRSIIEERFDRDTHRLDGGASSKDDVIDFSHLADTSPMYDKNQIFIIEEIDQLSPKAKNALLKLIEKPIKNTYFILLSMNTSGIIPALQSRCQVFTFYPFTTKDILLALQGSLKKIGIWEKIGKEIPETFIDVLRIIADSSQGSLRTAVQTLESCLTSELYTEEEVRKTFGLVSASSINEMLFSLLNIKKEFFIQFEDTDVQEFFNLSYNILSSAAVYRITQQAKNEYFEEQTKALSIHKNLDEVLKIFDDIQVTCGMYLKKSYIMSKISQFYFSKKARRIEE
jgi:DNA polymerase-3 subunit gamma/tau